MGVKMLTLFLVIVMINAQPFGSNFSPFSLTGQDCCDHNKIVVSGEGTSSGLPDIAKITVRF